MKQKWFRTLCAFTAALVFTIGIGVASPLVADARGSGKSYTTTTPKSGYKTGGYTAPKSSGGSKSYTTPQSGGSGFFGGTNGGRTFFSSGSRFFFFPWFFGSNGYGGFGVGFSAWRLLRNIIIVIVIILIIRWLIRRRRGM